MKTCMVSEAAAHTGGQICMYIIVYMVPLAVYVYNYIIYACDSQRLIGNVPNDPRI